MIKVICLSLSIVLAGCSSTSAPVSNNKAGTIKRERAAEIQTGMVTKVKQVTVLGKQSSAGYSVGRVAGSIAGGAVGSGYGSVAGSIAGAFIGGKLGSNADKGLQKKSGLEVSVKLDSGEHVTVTQLAKISFKPGDHVHLVMKGDNAEVEHRK